MPLVPGRCRTLPASPSTLHALGVRVSAEVMRKQHDILITNVPGPQVPLYAAGARMVASYPLLPLSAAHLLTIGLTSYDGEVFVGLTGDRYAIRDLDVLAQCLEDAVQELLDATADAASLRQPTRKASPAARRAAERKAAAKQEAARRLVGDIPPALARGAANAADEPRARWGRRRSFRQQGAGEGAASGADPGLHRGCSVTTALLRALEPQTSTEEAEFAALNCWCAGSVGQLGAHTVGARRGG